MPTGGPLGLPLGGCPRGNHESAQGSPVDSSSSTDGERSQSLAQDLQDALIPSVLPPADAAPDTPGVSVELGVLFSQLIDLLWGGGIEEAWDCENLARTCQLFEVAWATIGRLARAPCQPSSRLQQYSVRMQSSLSAAWCRHFLGHEPFADKEGAALCRNKPPAQGTAWD